MKDKNKSIQSDANHKMLFNSDGFESFVKILSAFVKSVLFIFVALIHALSCCLSQPKKSKSFGNFVSTDITKTDEENKLDGTGYYK